MCKERIEASMADIRYRSLEKRHVSILMEDFACEVQDD